MPSGIYLFLDETAYTKFGVGSLGESQGDTQAICSEAR